MDGTKSAAAPVVVHWFRKGLRLHDNPALLSAIATAEHEQCILRPVFVIDTERPYRVGPNRWRFLIEALNDLDNSLRGIGLRLFVLTGEVKGLFSRLLEDWNVIALTFETDTEPYGKARDNTVKELASKYKLSVSEFHSHTLYDPDTLIRLNGGNAPRKYSKLIDVMNRAGPPTGPCEAPKAALQTEVDPLLAANDFLIPTLKELKIDLSELGPQVVPGGEKEALKRLDDVMSNVSYLQNFSKPKTAPNSLSPSTTVFSPYLSFGCLSIRLLYDRLKSMKGVKTKPPTSLLGQLFWREFFYTIGTDTPNFTRMKGNPICKQIEWDVNEDYVKRWKEARTGFPFIDAIMTQLRREGWIHHLARHAVACFLTRGDLYQSWERGQEVFEEWLLDADVYVNAGNWMWLSASAFFFQYYRCYSPVKFGEKTDPSGAYIRKYLPILAKFPDKYIYEPWQAPESVQKECDCIIGKDYPEPIVDHSTISKKNMQRHKANYRGVQNVEPEEEKKNSRKRSNEVENKFGKKVRR